MRLDRKESAPALRFPRVILVFIVLAFAAGAASFALASGVEEGSEGRRHLQLRAPQRRRRT